jgi:phosphopantothenate synthetase
MKRRVEGHPELTKDVSTGVIDIHDNSDRARYRLAKQQAQMVQDSKAEISELKDELKELSSLKEEMHEIKDLLKKLLSN